LLGESAGSASAMAHMFADDRLIIIHNIFNYINSHALFSRVIAQSGSIINNWASKPKASIFHISLQLARHLNCSVNSNTTEGLQNVVDCLRLIPTTIIQRASDAVSESLQLPMDFAFVPIGLVLFY
jgi:carboxylesterase type B